MDPFELPEQPATNTRQQQRMFNCLSNGDFTWQLNDTDPIEQRCVNIIIVAVVYLIKETLCKMLQ